MRTQMKEAMADEARTGLRISVRRAIVRGLEKTIRAKRRLSQDMLAQAAPEHRSQARQGVQNCKIGLSQLLE